MFKYVVNSCCTSLFGCGCIHPLHPRGQCDSLQHYLECPILWCLIDAAIALPVGTSSSERLAIAYRSGDPRLLGVAHMVTTSVSSARVPVITRKHMYYIHVPYPFWLKFAVVRRVLKWTYGVLSDQPGTSLLLLCVGRCRLRDRDYYCRRVHYVVTTRMPHQRSYFSCAGVFTSAQRDRACKDRWYSSKVLATSGKCAKVVAQAAVPVAQVTKVQCRVNTSLRMSLADISEEEDCLPDEWEELCPTIEPPTCAPLANFNNCSKIEAALTPGVKGKSRVLVSVPNKGYKSPSNSGSGTAGNTEEL